MYEESEDHPEVPLSGGNMSGVVRVGATVRRNSGLWTPAVHALLRYLDATGFQGAPRVLGMDTNGREVLAYFDGDVFQYPMPDFVWTEEALVAVARLLRTYHDTVREFVPPQGAAWQIHVGAPASGPVICHNDIAPYNTVFRDGEPVGFIDWSEAAPGPALYDVAHALWRWVPLQEASWAPVENQPRRLRLFCDAYGLAANDREQVLWYVRYRQEVVLATLETWGRAGKPGWEMLWRIGHAQTIVDSLAWLEENKESLASSLAP